MTEAKPDIAWPDGKRFAFTIFDDPDGQTLDISQKIYGVLAESGLRTTKAVWPIGPRRQRNSSGDTCESADFAKHCQALQAAGFEIAYHNAAPHDSNRGETEEALNVFREAFGHDPESMANHYINKDAIYWGAARLTGLTKKIYSASQLWHDHSFFGHEPDSEYFWGDLCVERVRYCRNFGFTELNTLKACPWMPYADPRRPFVAQWYACAEGADVDEFCGALSESAQDQLESEGGASVLYTHFGKGFVKNGVVNPEFVRLIRRMSAKQGWFVPVSRLLDYIRAQRGECTITDSQRTRLERHWLREKLLGRVSSKIASVLRPDRITG